MKNALIDMRQGWGKSISWLSEVQKCVHKFGNGEPWGCAGDIPKNKVVRELIDKMKLHYVHQWRAVINGESVGRCQGKPKLRTYCLFKDAFCFEQYLKSNDREFRHIFTKLRIGNLKLAIELGRHHKPKKLPVEERLCKGCGLIEDEFHFIMECSMFKKARDIFWDGIIGCEKNEWSDGYKFTFVMKGGLTDLDLSFIIKFIKNISRDRWGKN